MSNENLPGRDNPSPDRGLVPADAAASRTVATRPELVKNPSLDRLAEIIKTSRLDQNYITTKLAELSSRDNNELIGACLEIHLWQVLEKASQSDEFRGRINLNPLARLSGQTENYAFSSKGKNVSVEGRNAKGFFNVVCEYDAWIELDGLPVVLEAKTGVQRKMGSKRRLSNYMKESAIVKLFNPLQDLYQRNDFGYFIVTTPESLANPSANRDAFVNERGGYLAAISSSFDQLSDTVRGFLGRRPRGQISRERRRTRSQSSPGAR